MSGMPLHPAIVHIPLGLAFIVPLVALGVTLVLRRGAFPRRIWLLVVGLQAVVLTGGLAALRTGHHEEERVERVIDQEEPIHEHEEAAEAFVTAAGILFLVSAAGLALRSDRSRRLLAAAATAGAFAVAGLAMRAGHLGGELVYTYGAAEAYGPSAAPVDGTPRSDADD
jgi:hypothetical protein